MYRENSMLLTIVYRAILGIDTHQAIESSFMKSRSIMTLECPWYLSFFLFNIRLFVYSVQSMLKMLNYSHFSRYKIQFPLENLIKKHQYTLSTKNLLSDSSNYPLISFVGLKFTVTESIAVYLQIKFPRVSSKFETR